MYTPITIGKNLSGPSKASKTSSSICVEDFFTIAFNLPTTIFENKDLNRTKSIRIRIPINTLLKSIPNTPCDQTEETKSKKLSIVSF